MAKVMPPPNGDAERLRRWPYIPPQSVAGIQGRTCLRPEHPVLPFAEHAHPLYQMRIEWKFTPRLQRLHLVNISAIDPPRDCKHGTRNVRPRDGDCFSNSQSGSC